MAVARFALGQHRSGGDVESGKQGRGAVSDIVVGDSFHIAESHGQNRLGAIQSLNLRLLVDGRARAHDRAG